jgi:hypothetical protein
MTPKFIIVPGKPASKRLSTRRTRLYLPSGHEVKGIVTLNVEACEPTVFYADGRVDYPKNRLSTITLHLGPSDVSIKATPPRKSPK